MHQAVHLVVPCRCGEGIHSWGYGSLQSGEAVGEDGGVAGRSVGWDLAILLFLSDVYRAWGLLRGSPATLLEEALAINLGWTFAVLLRGRILARVSAELDDEDDGVLYSALSGLSKSPRNCRLSAPMITG